jgi:broad specificity phosphatase PhoE
VLLPLPAIHTTTNHTPLAMHTDGHSSIMAAAGAAAAFAVLMGALVRSRANAQRHDGREAARIIRTRKAKLRNVYVVVRHGQSKANAAELIVSDPVVGVAKYGLTPKGEQQANAAGDLIARSLEALDVRRNVTVLSSDFSRARETAQIVANQLTQAGSRIDTSTNGEGVVTLEPRLRERFFGTLDGQSSELYGEVWKHDVVSVHHEEYGSEPIAAVLARTTELIMETESRLEGHVVLLVAHGDVNQIVRSAFRDHLTPSQHRSDEHLSPASARCLNCEKLNDLLRIG